MCERCKENGLIVPGVIVHHKIHLTPENIQDPEILTDKKNLMLVCRNCHAALHAREKRYRFDEMGRILVNL